MDSTKIKDLTVDYINKIMEAHPGTGLLYANEVEKYSKSAQDKDVFYYEIGDNAIKEPEKAVKIKIRVEVL